MTRGCRPPCWLGNGSCGTAWPRCRRRSPGLAGLRTGHGCKSKCSEILNFCTQLCRVRRDSAAMQILSSLLKLGGVVADWVFPAACAACGAGMERGAALCEGCRESLTPLPPACPRCAQPTGAQAIRCRRCRIHPLPLDAIIAPWLYGGELATALRRLKFSRDVASARELAPLWAGALAATVHVHGADLIVPIPLHWRRRWHRGFDQNTLLVGHAVNCAAISAPITHCLRRTRHTKEQSLLAARERQNNLIGAFIVPAAQRANIAGKRVVLVDDVVTTGATMAAAARALHRAGVAAVIGVALARAE